MDRRLDITTRVVAALMLALLLVVPVAGPICAAVAAPSACETACSQAGYMSVDCARTMGDGGCGKASPGPQRQEKAAVVSSAPAQAPVVAATSVPQRLETSADALLISMRSSRVERPPLDPLGVRIRI